MSVVIVGGNKLMERRYKDICGEYQCSAKVLTKMTGTFQNKIGSSDLLVLFTNTVSHKMIRCAICEIKGTNTVIERCHSSSMTALKAILQKHTSGGALCPN